MEHLPQIFVISLTRSSDRRAAIQKRFTQLGIRYRFFDAVDGNQLTVQDWERVCLERAKAEYGKYVSKAEIGCALSHLRIYEKCLAENIDNVLILEDDIIVPDNFPELLATLFAKKNHQCEMALIFHGKCKSSWFYRTLSDKHKLKKLKAPSANSKRVVTGTAGYWINRSGMQKLLNMGYPVRMPADYLTGLIQKNRLNCYVVEPNLVQTGGFASTILREEADRHQSHAEMRQHCGFEPS